MSDLLGFLTSPEIMVVYVVAGIAILLCFIIYLVERNNSKFRQKHNTRELNKLVEQIKEEMPEATEQELYEEPILQSLEENESTSVVEMLEETEELQTMDDVPQVVPLRKESSQETILVETRNSVSDIEEKDSSYEEELEYTTIEPDQATAQLELKKLTEELKRQEELKEQTTENIQLTNYEEQQEENAIISLEELVRKSKDMYEANELSQYADEGNEPISLQELEKRVGVNATSYEDTFVIEEVVPKEEMLEPMEEETPKPTMKLDDFQTIPVSKENEVTETESVKRFKSSPIISPIYGIEKQVAESTDIQLENTANYEKLDAEIKKTNEFLMTLKDLQKKLDQ